MPQVINKDESSRGDRLRPTKETEELPTHYALLGVPEDATQEELKVAFRTKALHEHPDKGGDADRFHDLQMAYNVLEMQDKRDAYDDELQRERDRKEFVEGAPIRRDTTNAAVARVKTAPTPGSKRNKKMEGLGGNEWKAHGTGIGQLRMIEDGASPEAKAEVLFSKYQELPRVKERKREWLRSVGGAEKIALKAAAKAHEKAQMDKWNKWLVKPAPTKSRTAGTTRAAPTAPTASVAEGATAPSPVAATDDEATTTTA